MKKVEFLRSEDTLGASFSEIFFIVLSAISILISIVMIFSYHFLSPRQGKASSRDLTSE